MTKSIREPGGLTQLRRENAELKAAVIAFGAPRMAEHGRNLGLPDGHLAAEHYDLLQRCGARMDDFVRGEEQPQAQETPNG